MCFGPGVVDMGGPLVGRECVLVLGLLILTSSECVLVLGLLIWVHL